MECSQRTIMGMVSIMVGIFATKNPYCWAIHSYIPTAELNCFPLRDNYLPSFEALCFLFVTPQSDFTMLTGSNDLCQNSWKKSPNIPLLSPSPLQCRFLVRLRSALGHNQAAELLSFKFGDRIFGPTLFMGRGCGKSKRWSFLRYILYG